MQTNIEKLAEELSALVAPYPNPLNCNSATISSRGGKHRIVMDHWMGTHFKFTFDFDKVLPFDPKGGKGKTNDVFTHARISVNSPHGDGHNGPTKEEVDRYCTLYLQSVYAALQEQASAGRITSKTLAEMQVSKPNEDMMSEATQDMIAVNPKHIVDATSAQTVEEFIDIVQKDSPALADALRRDHGLETKKKPRKPRKK